MGQAGEGGGPAGLPFFPFIYEEGCPTGQPFLLDPSGWAEAGQGYTLGMHKTWIAGLVVAAGLLLACGGGAGAFVPIVETLPDYSASPPGAAGMAFSIVADMRNLVGPTEFAGAVASMAGVGPGGLIVSPGDIDPPDQVELAIRGSLGAIPWLPVVGNHEAETPSDMAFLRAYDTAGQAGAAGGAHYSGGPSGAATTCYSFDAGGAHFAFINEYYDGSSDIGIIPGPSDPLAGTISPALLAWLEGDLVAAAARSPAYIFVFGHEPLYSLPDAATARLRHAGECLDAHPDEVRAFIALLKKHSVTAYVCGHTHDYSAALVDGIPQIDAGHARGSADTGAPSTWLKVQLYSSFAEISPYRSTDGTAYSIPALASVIRLLHR